jgi:hypothetical protein
MKKIFNIILGCVALLTIGACSDSQFDKNYADPSKTSNVSCDRLMTGVIESCREYAMCGYARSFEIDSEFLGHAAQVYGFLNSKNHAYAGIGFEYNNWRWQSFYRAVNQLMLLKATYDKLDDTQKANNKMFVDCAEIDLYEQLEEMVDLWGDIPFSKAGTLGLTFDMTTCKPAYDKATDLYKMMMDDCKTIATELPTLTKPSNLAAQDCICNGDVSKWVKFANGLRMRLAMRCATQGSMASTGQAVLKEIFDGNTTMITGNNDEISVAIASKGGDYRLPIGSIETWSGECNRASQAMFDALNYTKGEDITDFTKVDPRFQIMYDPAPLTVDGKNKEYQYNGMSTEESISQQNKNYNNGKGNYYSAIDSATFNRNDNMINMLLSASEVDLTHAEAIARNYVAGDAKAFFVKGVVESIKFHFKEYSVTSYNGLNTSLSYRTNVVVPTEAQMTAYAESIWDATNPLKCICTQEWLNYSILQTPQAYFNVRRTGYPELKVVSFANETGVTCGLPIERFEYPADEVNYNADNLKAELDANFGGTDSWYTPIFWSKPNWYTVIPANN